MPECATSLPDYHICIVGSGPVGLTLALATADAGLNVALVTRDNLQNADAASQDGRAFSIALGCWRMWQTLNVAANMAPYAQPVRSLTAEGGGAHPAIFDADDLQEAGDPLGYMIPAGRIVAALNTAVTANANISVFPEATIEDIQDDGAHVRVTGKGIPALSTHIVAGCDGRNSVVRRLAGIQLFSHEYNAHGVVATVKLLRPHNDAARQVFLPSGPLAVLPLPDDRANIVWSVPSDLAQTLTDLNADDFAAELAEQAGDFVGPFTIEGARLSYPLRLQVAETMAEGNIALVGDAAHAVHPLAGQGLNLGLKDAAALAEVLGNTVHAGLDPSASTALEDYARWRRADVMTAALAMDELERIFRSKGILRCAAGLGMSLTSQSKTLRHMFTREAGGLTGDLPRLFNGQSLSPG